MNETTEDYINDLLPSQGSGGNEEIAAYNDLPDLSLAEFLSVGIRTILAWSMLLTIVALVVSGIFFLTAESKDEQIAKAKTIIVYLLIGLIIMASAYAIIVGLSRFNFLESL